MESQGRESKQRAAKNSDLGTWLKWMFLSWCVYLPVFLAVYPGIYSYDASAQLLQFYGKLPLTTHHPLIHTLYLGLCMKIAGRLFHTYQAGMALYALSQSFFNECGIFPVSVPDESAAGTAMALRCFVDVLDPESVSDGLFLCHDEGCALWRIFPAGI